MVMMVAVTVKVVAIGASIICAVVMMMMMVMMVSVITIISRCVTIAVTVDGVVVMMLVGRRSDNPSSSSTHASFHTSGMTSANDVRYGHLRQADSARSHVQTVVPLQMNNKATTVVTTTA